MKCFGCGEEGHIEPYCPHAAALDASGKPPWCGLCDERTRLLGLAVASRCPDCHPQRGRSLRQHRKCPRCHVTVYAWDEESCGSHAGPGIPDRRPEREIIDRRPAVAGLKDQLAGRDPLDGAA